MESYAVYAVKSHYAGSHIEKYQSWLAEQQHGEQITILKQQSTYGRRGFTSYVLIYTDE